MQCSHFIPQILHSHFPIIRLFWSRSFLLSPAFFSCRAPLVPCSLPRHLFIFLFILLFVEFVTCPLHFIRLSYIQFSSDETFSVSTALTILSLSSLSTCVTFPELYHILFPFPYVLPINYHFLQWSPVHFFQHSSLPYECYSLPFSRFFFVLGFLFSALSRRLFPPPFTSCFPWEVTAISRQPTSRVSFVLLSSILLLDMKRDTGVAVVTAGRSMRGRQMKTSERAARRNVTESSIHIALTGS